MRKLISKGVVMGHNSILKVRADWPGGRGIFTHPPDTRAGSVTIDALFSAQVVDNPLNSFSGLKDVSVPQFDLATASGAHETNLLFNAPAGVFNFFFNCGVDGVLNTQKSGGHVGDVPGQGPWYLSPVDLVKKSKLQTRISIVDILEFGSDGSYITIIDWPGGPGFIHSGEVQDRTEGSQITGEFFFDTQAGEIPQPDFDFSGNSLPEGTDLVGENSIFFNVPAGRFHFTFTGTLKTSAWYLDSDLSLLF